MSTSKKLDEITELAILLQNSYGGYTIDELSEKLERPRRAIERMMEVLREKFGERLEYITIQTDRKKHWRLKKGTMNFLVTFSDSEIAKLEKLKNLLPNQNEQKSILEIIEKIKVLNPKSNHKTDIDILLEAQGYAVRQQPKEHLNQEILEKIELGILSQKKLKLSYMDSFGNYYEPKVDAYGLKIGINYYLIAKENEKVKTFKLSRIKNIEILEEDSFIPEDFNIQEYCNISFGVYTDEPMNVEIMFSKETAEDVINYSFHPTQEFVQQKDGTVILKFRASGSYEIITELLKWRNEIKIISPQKLRLEYENTVKSMYENIKE